MAATLAAVAMLGCPSAVNAPPTASSASTVAPPTSAGAESTRELKAATTRTPLTANFVLVPSDHDGSPFAVQLHFSEPIDNKPRHVKQAFSVIGGTTEAPSPRRNV